MRRLVLLACAVALGGCGDDTPSGVPVPPRVADVRIDRDSADLLAGLTLQLAATTLDSAGHPLSGRTVTWSSSNAAIVSVSAGGLLTALAVGGPVTITAASEGRSGVATVVVWPGVATGIGHVAEFIERCPTQDSAIARIRADFELRSDGQPITAPIPCSEPISAMPASQLSYELVALQALRAAYYLGRGTAGRLPWTPLSFYDWLRSHVGGINIKTAQSGQQYCCDMIDGKLYISTSRWLSWFPGATAWSGGIANVLAYYAHEARHTDAEAPGHLNGCPDFPLATDPPGCDATYDPTHLGAYGIQYWLEASWATGYLNVGIACARADSAAAVARQHERNANSYRGRFVSDPPPLVEAKAPFGGACVTR